MSEFKKQRDEYVNWLWTTTDDEIIDELSRPLSDPFSDQIDREALRRILKNQKKILNILQDFKRIVEKE